MLVLIIKDNIIKGGKLEIDKHRSFQSGVKIKMKFRTKFNNSFIYKPYISVSNVFGYSLNAYFNLQ